MLFFAFRALLCHALRRPAFHSIPGDAIPCEPQQLGPLRFFAFLALRCLALRDGTYLLVAPLWLCWRYLALLGYAKRWLAFLALLCPAIVGNAHRCCPNQSWLCYALRSAATLWEPVLCWRCRTLLYIRLPSDDLRCHAKIFLPGTPWQCAPFRCWTILPFPLLSWRSRACQFVPQPADGSRCHP